MPPSLHTGILDHPPRAASGAKLWRSATSANLAVQIANDIWEAAREAPDQEYEVAEWDFVSPTAVVDEYMENMYQCVSSI